MDGFRFSLSLEKERSRYHGANPDCLPDIPRDRALVRRVRRAAIAAGSALI